MDPTLTVSTSCSLTGQSAQVSHVQIRCTLHTSSCTTLTAGIATVHDHRAVKKRADIKRPAM